MEADWRSAIERSFPDDTPLYTFSTALNTALMRETREALMTKYRTWLKESGFSFDPTKEMPFLRLRNATHMGPAYDRRSGGFTFNVLVQEFVTDTMPRIVDEDPIVGTDGLLTYTKEKSEKLPDVSFSVVVPRPCQHFEDAVCAGLKEAINSLVLAGKAPGRHPGGASLQDCAQTVLFNKWKELHQKFELEFYRRASSGYWLEATCTFEWEATGNYTLSTKWEGREWYDDEERDEREFSVQVTNDTVRGQWPDPANQYVFGPVLTTSSKSTRSQVKRPGSQVFL